MPPEFRSYSFVPTRVTPVTLIVPTDAGQNGSVTEQLSVVVQPLLSVIITVYKFEFNPDILEEVWPVAGGGDQE